jgi:hypothetical protein
VKSQAIGIGGALVVTVGVFLPVLSFKYVEPSLWDFHRVTACMLLACAGVAIYSCGARLPRFLVTAGIGVGVVTFGQLLIVIFRVKSQLADNVEFAKREPGWAGLAALGIPKVHWMGWTVIGVGAALILVAGIIRPPQPVVNPTGNTPAT